MSLTRRHLLQMGLAAAPALALLAKEKFNSRINGVMIGAYSYSFREMSLDQVLDAYKELELGFVELWEGHVSGTSPMEQKKWLANAQPIDMRLLKRKFDDGGMTLYAWNYNFRDDASDTDIQRVFELARALGVKNLTTSSPVAVAKRLDPYGRRHKITIAECNRAEGRKDDFTNPDDFAEAMRETTNIGINLDIGDFTAAGYDPTMFLDQNHERIVSLRIKDRKKQQGPNTPFGHGDTPIKAVLQSLKKNAYKIPAMIDYEYSGGNPIDELRRCFDYCKEALA